MILLIMILLIGISIGIVFGFLYFFPNGGFDQWRDKVSIWWRDCLFKFTHASHRVFMKIMLRLDKILENTERRYLNHSFYHAKSYYQLLDRMEKHRRETIWFHEPLETSNVIELPKEESNGAL